MNVRGSFGELISDFLLSKGEEEVKRVVVQRELARRSRAVEPGNELVLVCINTKAGTSLSEKTWRDRGRVAMLFWTRRQDSEEGSERSLRYWSELGMQHKRIGL